MIKKTLQALTLASLLSCPSFLQAKPPQNYSLLPQTQETVYNSNFPKFNLETELPKITLADNSDNSLECKCKKGDCPSYLCPNIPVEEPKREEVYRPPLKEERILEEDKIIPSSSSTKTTRDYVWGGLGTTIGSSLIIFGLLPRTFCDSYVRETNCERGITPTGYLMIGSGALLLAGGIYLLVK